MKNFIKHFFKFKTLFLLLAFLVAGHNFLSLLKTLSLSLAKQKYQTFLEPGYEFADFRNKLSGVKRVGFLTNKDMSSEKNDGQFLAAQYILAPIILDLDNTSAQFVIMDSTSLIPSFDFMRKLHIEPIHINEYGKVLARKSHD